MDAATSMNAFNEGAAIWFNAAVIGASASILASYISAFLTPKTKSRSLAALLTGAAYFAIDFFFGSITIAGLYTPLFSMLKTVAASALTLGASCLLFERELGKQAFLLLSFAAVRSISALLVNFLFYAFPLSMWFFDYISALPIPPERLILYTHASIAANFVFSGAIYAALLFLSIRGITKSFIYKKRRLGSAESATLILPCLPVFIIVYAMRTVIAEDALNGLQSLNESYGVLILLSCIILLLTLIASARLVQKSTALHIEEKNAAILREQIKEIQKRDSGGVYVEIRGMRHDMKNHLSNLRFLLAAAGDDRESASELNNYLGQMNKTLERFDLAFQTGNSVTDAIIHGRYLEARRKGIDFTSEFTYPSSSGIDAYDLAVILQNALDNALEACESTAEAERFIRLRSRSKAGTFFVEISNSYAGTVAFDGQTGLPLSSKPDSHNHGLGISNIKRSAEKYRGGIDIRLTEHVFTLVVILQAAAV